MLMLNVSCWAFTSVQCTLKLPDKYPCSRKRSQYAVHITHYQNHILRSKPKVVAYHEQSNWYFSKYETTRRSPRNGKIHFGCISRLYQQLKRDGWNNLTYNVFSAVCILVTKTRKQCSHFVNVQLEIISNLPSTVNKPFILFVIVVTFYFSNIFVEN